jgi:hypothetical protein
LPQRLLEQRKKIREQVEHRKRERHTWW